MSDAPPPAQGLNVPDQSLPRDVAANWLQAVRTLERSVAHLHAAADSIVDAEWRARVSRFLEQARPLLAETPLLELEAVVNARLALPVSSRPQPTAQGNPRDEATLVAAGFAEGAPLLTVALANEHIRLLTRELRAFAAAATRYAEGVLDAPLIRLEGAEGDLHHALAQFEIARLMKPPLAQAQENLLGRLISGPLEPLLRELIAALTRFEWYFHPLRMSVARGEVHLTGLATDSERLDVRMLLNAGERSIVSVAWFLALHLLQPRTSRRVLVLDDPFSALDDNNQASLVSTLRTVTRLTRPDLLVLTSHDRRVIDALE
ncbi:MAG TPA: hypothetical protein VK993_14110, partial [Chthoniobacterales bacterium]|nr:hypothetical protein [Chthoniobacterales bacterium]